MRKTAKIATPAKVARAAARPRSERQAAPSEPIPASTSNPIPLATLLAAPAAQAPAPIVTPIRPPERVRAVSNISESPGFAASAKVINLPEGLYALTIAGVENGHEFEGLATPATLVAPIGEGLRLLASASAPGGWVGPGGGAVVLEASPVGGRVAITTYRPATTAALPLAIHVSRLDRPRAPPSQPAPKDGAFGLVVKVHVEKQGAVLGKASEWCGTPGGKRRIEAFEMQPVEGLQAQDIEYKAFAPNGRETGWKSGGEICGAVGRGMPLVGFAVRLAPTAADRYVARYRAAFFEGDVSEAQDGAACLPKREGDWLEAIEVSILRRD